MRFLVRILLPACLMLLPACGKKDGADGERKTAEVKEQPKTLTKEFLIGSKWQGTSEKGMMTELTFHSPQGQDRWGPCMVVLTESNPDRLTYSGSVSYTIESESNQVRFNAIGQEISEGATASLTPEGDLLLSGYLLSVNSPADKRPEVRLKSVKATESKK